MSHLRRGMALAVCFALLISLTGCFGSFNLTQKAHRWNDEVSENTWVKELVHIPWSLVYVGAAVADWTVCNSIEFWKDVLGHGHGDDDHGDDGDGDEDGDGGDS